jgi:hypothetical protein
LAENVYVHLPGPQNNSHLLSQTGLTAAAGGTSQLAQPQVKIITPQGRMQMQQIQTPSGPKLIAVPVGGGSIQV